MLWRNVLEDVSHGRSWRLTRTIRMSGTGTRLLLIRQGRRQHSQGRYYQHDCPGLDDIGIAQAKALAVRLTRDPTRTSGAIIASKARRSFVAFGKMPVQQAVQVWSEGERATGCFTMPARTSESPDLPRRTRITLRCLTEDLEQVIPAPENRSGRPQSPHDGRGTAAYDD